MTYQYPTYEELVASGYTPEKLYIGAAAMHALNGTVAPATRVMPEAADKETTRTQVEHHRRARGAKPRMYKSRFVGVTLHRGRWVAQWGKNGAHVGHGQPQTPEGEIAAAWERAHVLGRPGLEERHAAQVCKPEPTPPLDPRGHAKQPLGGKRVA